MDIAEVIERVRELRVEVDRPAIAFARLDRLAHRLQRAAQVVMGFCHRRVQGQCLLERGGGIAGISLRQQRATHHVMEHRRPAVGHDALSQPIDHGAVIAGLMREVPQRRQGIGLVRSLEQDRLVSRLRLTRFAGDAKSRGAAQRFRDRLIARRRASRVRLDLPLPDLDVTTLQRPGKPGLVHERRSAHPLAHPAAQPGQGAQVGCQGRACSDVGVDILRHQLAQPHGVQQA
ncbi:hypothetical protein D3C83_07230 [compost metagenome]